MPELRRHSLPDTVRDIAVQLGATRQAFAASVAIEQAGTMLLKPNGRVLSFSAHQTIMLDHPAFEWRAKTGPFGCISIIDALTAGSGLLDVRLFGRFRLAHAEDSATTRGEVMRYLAELPWAPDAILMNESLDWTVVDDRTIRVACGEGESRGEVELHLDGYDRIISMRAERRPAMEGKQVVERPWIGRYFDYREHHGRWLPFAGEVAWVIDGEEFVYLRGRMLKWTVA